MIISVNVSTEGTAQETIARAATAISEAKQRMGGRIENIAVSGPQFALVGGKLQLRYRMTNMEVSEWGKLWRVRPNVTVRV